MALVWGGLGRGKSVIRSRCLDRGCQCCKNTRNLKMESKAHLRKTCSNTILLCVTHKIQTSTTNTSQKRRLLHPVWLVRLWRNPTRSRASQWGPRVSRTKLQRTLGTGQVKRMWVPVFRTPQRGSNPFLGPCLLITSIPNGRRPRNNFEAHILIFKGKGAFQSREVQTIDGRWYREWYAESTKKTPEGARHQDTVSG